MPLNQSYGNEMLLGSLSCRVCSFAAVVVVNIIFTELTRKTRMLALTLATGHHPPQCTLPARTTDPLRYKSTHNYTLTQAKCINPQW